MTARGDSTKRIDTHRTALDITTATDAQRCGGSTQTSSTSIARMSTHATSISSMCGCFRTMHLRAPCPTPVNATLPASQHAPEHGEQDRLTGDLRTGGRTTRGPLRGRLPPPSKGGSKGPGRGRTPTQHTILRLEPATAKPMYLSQSSIFISCCWC
jgi:hypothetical protein